MEESFCRTLTVLHLTCLHCVRFSCLIGHVLGCAAICESPFSYVIMISLATSIVMEEVAVSCNAWPLSAPVPTQEGTDEAIFRSLPVGGSFCSTLIVLHLTRLHCVCCSCVIGHVLVFATYCASPFSYVSMISLASSIFTEETAKAATPCSLSSCALMQEDTCEATHTLR